MCWVCVSVVRVVVGLLVFDSSGPCYVNGTLYTPTAQILLQKSCRRRAGLSPMGVGVGKVIIPPSLPSHSGIHTTV